MPLHLPVLDRPQVPRRIAVPAQTVAKNLTDGGGKRRKLRLDSGRQIGLLQSFRHLLPREIVGHLVVEGDDDVRQSELGVRKYPHRMRQSAQHDFERNGHLLFHLFRRPARIERDDGRLHIRDVRKRLDGQLLEGNDAAADKEHCHQRDEHRLVQREMDEPFNHGRDTVRSLNAGVESLLGEVSSAAVVQFLEQDTAISHHALADLQTVADADSSILFRTDLDFAPDKAAGLLLDKHEVFRRFHDHRH